MFSPTLGELNLMQIDLNTDIVRIFKVEIQRIIVQSVSLEIISNLQEFQSKLCTHDHCKWVMEVIGCGFTLPVDDHKTIAHCISLYEEWFINLQNVPTPIEEMRDHYDRIAMAQLTNLLYQRSGSAESLNGYAELCLRAISILRAIGTRYKPGSDMSRQLVCCLLGCMQDVCGKQHVNSQNVIISYIAEKLIHAVYEVWLNYGEADEELWGVFQECHKVWAKTKEVALAWVDITLRLQKTFLAAVESKQNDVNLVTTNEKVQIDAHYTLKYFLKTWIRFIHLCGTPAQLQDAAVVLVITDGISLFVKNMIECYKDGRYPNAPDGNTIIKLFGEPLAQVVLCLDHIRYELAVNVAVTTIGTVFGVTTARTTFRPENLSILYEVMSEAILSRNGKIILSGIKILNKLLLLSFPSQEIIYPSIIKAAERISNMVDPGSLDTRTSCIELLGLIHLSFSKQRQEIACHEVGTDTIFCFSNFSKQFLAICEVFLQTETNPVNLKDMFVLLSRFFNDIVPRDGSTIVEQFIPVLEKNIYKFVGALVEKRLHESFTEMMRVLKTVLVEVGEHKVLLDLLMIIHSFIETYYKSSPIIDDFLQVYSIYFGACYSFIQQDTLLKVIGLCGQICAWFNDQQKRASLENYTFPQSLLSSLQIDVVDYFEEMNEVILMNAYNDHQIQAFDEFMKIFVYKDQAVITVAELPWEKGSAIVIIRTKYGKTARYVHLTHDENKKTVISGVLTKGNDEVMKESEIPVSWLEEFNTVSLDKIVTAEKASNNVPHVAQNEDVLPASALYNTNLCCKAIISRTLIGALGLVDLSGEKLHPLGLSDDLITSLLELDVLPTRNLIGVTILYGPDSSAPSPIYNSVIRGLGHIVDPQTHKGFSGLYAGGDQKFMYYSNEEAEMVFHINTLGGLNEEEAVDADNIVVFWNSSPYDTEIETIEGKFTIIILPTQSDVLRVMTNSPCGVLVKEQLVSPASLPGLIRHAALNYSRPVYLAPTTNPIYKRSEYIRSLNLFVDVQNPRAEVHCLLSSETMQNVNSSNLQFCVEIVKTEKKEQRGNFLTRKATPKPAKAEPTDSDTKKKGHSFKLSLFSKKKKEDKEKDKTDKKERKERELERSSIN
ncbi:hypothetical protein EHI8A_022680 [Entamoeba histolytica HM-1:IMSS-B]|uniref:Ral GTPase-activating protein subunit alpha/beta N-terminal domain-containing protein n=6 Tax=Entamoeba histolytica TaxID=5759 RepID=C4M1D9_ENTH1|nr:hypothetical protein EHI_170170 [Entamoeba histolytica HM-1:IMSS]EMD45210.1 Hypothetical protein EHI5A_048730 [Entamoeba histolytica KU27]EMH73657.1 hypothetical protein EHI8A_022680 [Entamoeba histolytica HM-1:IMSS-B]EMS13350.1 hypothetical protein KM1_043660 [Entamoeba histolytica HM-3:IMSS]ENY64112.1 hypothetical protein EHI7A_026660 [Entamoeba histolytica HM-1:IMSS-A]GAT95017.1 hypothetical protein CL6EHI_170170 [Entamoeba histolytica]|eukprot:XP_655973.1 hypothetical protein EHI_170170 [Entamoeba histolytica HM-1:IMSS]